MKDFRIIVENEGTTYYYRTFGHNPLPKEGPYGEWVTDPEKATIFSTGKDVPAALAKVQSAALKRDPKTPPIEEAIEIRNNR